MYTLISILKDLNTILLILNQDKEQRSDVVKRILIIYELITVLDVISAILKMLQSKKEQTEVR